MSKTKGDKPTRTQEGVEVAYSSPTDAERARARAEAMQDFEAKKVSIGDLALELKDEGKYVIGQWSGLAQYGCPYCGFDSLAGDMIVEKHIEAVHPTEWLVDFEDDKPDTGPALDQEPVHVGPGSPRSEDSTNG